MPSSASSASHIYLLSLHDALPIYISLGTLLDVVVAHRGRRAQTVLHLLRVDDAALRGIEPPYAGVTVRLELEAHRQRVRRALVAPLHLRLHLVHRAEQVLHVVTDLVRDDVRFGELAGRAKFRT